MNKNIFFAFCFFLLTLTVVAQDRIYFKNNAVEEAKILEISKDEVMFKKLSNIDGPTYRELKSTIDKIVYANGLVDNFGDSKKPTKKEEKPAPKVQQEVVVTPYVFSRNAITYSITDVLFKRVTIAYEHILGNGILGIKIPISFGIGSNQVFDVNYLNSISNNYGNGATPYSSYVPADELEYTSIIRKYTFGLELNAYPFGQRRVSFFVGPAFYYGLIDFNYEEINYVLINGGSNYTYVISSKEDQGSSLSGMINTGFVFKTSPGFSLNLQIALGFRQNVTDFDDYPVTLFSPSFQVGYTF